jgi:pyruvate,water dikinase
MATHSQPTISWFADLGIRDRPTVGGKAASLGELLRAGADVPLGFVLTTAAFESFLATFDADRRTRRKIETLIGAEANVVESVCREIRAELENAALSPSLRAEIDEAYRRLCGDHQQRPVAVRSSATSEDSADASFAGLQDTFLWIKGVDDVVTSIKRCWSSLYSVESVTYRLRLSLPEDEVAMAVAVQQMVDARCAGVMFTRSPTTGDKSVIVMEAAWGLGSAVVSGEVTPDKFVINKITGEITKRNISVKTIQHVPHAILGKVIDVEVPAHLQQAPCVDDDEIRALAAIAKNIERHYGHAQDIEWAIEGRDGEEHKILLLQARPETVWSSRDAQKKAESGSVANPLAHVLSALSNRGKK